LLRQQLEAINIEIINLDWIEEVLAEPALRRAIAMAHIAQERNDSLAWWTLLKITNGISSAFIDYIATSTDFGETFGDAVLRMHPEFVGAPSERSRTTASQLVRQVLAAINAIDFARYIQDEDGWGGWLRRWVGIDVLSVDAHRLLQEVGRRVPVEDGLGYFLGQLEPVGKDLASNANAVRIMSMSSSKGITVNTAIVMGVESGIIPLPNGELNEERRLLYVAMTRATDLTVLTGAARRTGATARRGIENVNQPRGRSPLLTNIPIGQWQDGQEYVRRLRR